MLVALAAVSLAGCGTGGMVEDASTGTGKELFTEKCASCHTLADAQARGTIGPNLDDAFAPGLEQGFDDSTIEEIVLQQIRYPSTEQASPNAPKMPADLVEGEDAESVAAYVASVAGRPAATAAGGGGTQPPAGGAGGGGGADGKSIFASAGCGSCHVLADAGSNGTIGPNLDDAKPSKALAVDRVTNGQGAMPSFKDQLSKQQIDAVASYVAGAAGR